MHEQSQTIERDGKFFNISGVDGSVLEGPFDTLHSAVTSAEERSDRSGGKSMPGLSELLNLELPEKTTPQSESGRRIFNTGRALAGDSERLEDIEFRHQQNRQQLIAKNIQMRLELFQKGLESMVSNAADMDPDETEAMATKLFSLVEGIVPGIRKEDIARKVRLKQIHLDQVLAFLKSKVDNKEMPPTEAALRLTRVMTGKEDMGKLLEGSAAGRAKKAELKLEEAKQKRVQEDKAKLTALQKTTDEANIRERQRILKQQEIDARKAAAKLKTEQGRTGVLTKLQKQTQRRSERESARAQLTSEKGMFANLERREFGKTLAERQQVEAVLIDIVATRNNPDVFPGEVVFTIEEQAALTQAIVLQRRGGLKGSAVNKMAQARSFLKNRGMDDKQIEKIMKVLKRM